MANSTQRLREQAARWFIRMRKAEPDDPERGKFEAWLMSSPLHAREYAIIADTWESFDSTARLQSLATAMERKREEFLQQKNKFNKLAKQGLLGLVAFAISAVLGHTMWREWQAQPVMQVAYGTSAGEILRHTLEDGTQIVLNGGAKIHITYYRNRRVVALTSGEVIFDVARDEKRPFIVDATDAKVTVLGTSFAVNRLDQLVRVSVRHGAVRVEGKQLAPDVEPPYVILRDGQVAEIWRGQEPEIVQRSAADAFAFQSGTLVFENATLGEIAETLSRYRKTPVRAVVGHANASQITAVLQTHDIEKFISMLPKIASVRVQETPAETQLMSDSVH